MSLSFRDIGLDRWRAEVEGVELLLFGGGDAPEPALVAMAERVVADFAALKTRAADHLDMFVDRGRAGAKGAAWWLEAIEVRAEAVTLSFTLEGDDGGWWDVRFKPDGFWPASFQRLQQ